jgi:pyrroloquinoline quinone biosynthesis protein B
VKLKVLGSGAGGGFPQWNCNFRLSRSVREGSDGFLARTQSSVAVSQDGERWVICNASPDIRQQIAENHELWPRASGPVRNSPIKAVVLTNADVDHVTGLLGLREMQAFNIYATQRVIDVLLSNSIFRVCNPALVKRIPLELGKEIELEGPDGPLGVMLTPHPIPGKIALYLEDLSAGAKNFGTQEGDTIALRLRAKGETAYTFYIPGCSEIEGRLKDMVSGADLLLFDGTTYTDNELVEAGISDKTAMRMGHVSVGGGSGTLAAFKDVPIKRRVFVHINNTNPILEHGSDAEKAVKAAGWEIGRDGQEIII